MSFLEWIKMQAKEGDQRKFGWERRKSERSRLICVCLSNSSPPLEFVPRVWVWKRPDVSCWIRYSEFSCTVQPKNYAPFVPCCFSNLRVRSVVQSPMCVLFSYPVIEAFAVASLWRLRRMLPEKVSVCMCMTNADYIRDSRIKGSKTCKASYFVCCSDLGLDASKRVKKTSACVMYLAVVVGPVVGTATLGGGTNGGAGTDSGTGKDGSVHGDVWGEDG